MPLLSPTAPTETSTPLGATRQARARAVAARRDELLRQPQSAAAAHNLAAALADDSDWSAAESYIRSVVSRPGAAAESWQVYGRCLLMRADLVGAEDAFCKAIAFKPTLVNAQVDLAQLLWMKSGNRSFAMARFDDAVRYHPDDIALNTAHVRAIEYMGTERDTHALWQALAARFPDDAGIAVSAAHNAAAVGNANLALRHSARALNLEPGHPVALACRAAALLFLGDARAAEAVTVGLVTAYPEDQFAIALLATSWRLTNDHRYRALYQYDAFVRTFDMACPPGWPDLQTYLEELRDALTKAHVMVTHPFGQSVRNGSQVPDVLALPAPAAKALPAALTPAIRQYLAAIGPGNDLFRRRQMGGAACTGLWSIRMRAGGSHVSHVHPAGWISSACYIDVPGRSRPGSGELHLGKPGVPTSPDLAPERTVAPSVGKVVLFPSYMWHGVSVFQDDAARMSIAFDLEPARSLQF